MHVSAAVGGVHASFFTMAAATKRIGALLVQLPKPNVQVLSPSPRKHDSEITLYVKGFMTESERPKDYEAWTKWRSPQACFLKRSQLGRPRSSLQLALWQTPAELPCSLDGVLLVWYATQIRLPVSGSPRVLYRCRRNPARCQTRLKLPLGDSAIRALRLRARHRTPPVATIVLSASSRISLSRLPTCADGASRGASGDAPGHGTSMRPCIAGVRVQRGSVEGGLCTGEDVSVLHAKG
ncbi:hypothetical protein BC938DRAFT_477422 [Jimgerdemannia flammicorona]|uniref:Uncharacterized protein n=1 Tax=Jimgerdemannia flammicorona TaxID=994334 RepID=A0A433PA42_9FUNG|nr:hypothetical protein BC938DRAFT_477422 [Jimgerdemannia flammicorona]